MKMAKKTQVAKKKTKVKVTKVEPEQEGKDMKMDLTKLAEALRVDPAEKKSSPFHGLKSHVVECTGVEVENKVTKEMEVHHVGDEFYAEHYKGNETIRCKVDGELTYATHEDVRLVHTQDANAKDVNGEPLIKRCHACQAWFTRLRSRRHGPSTKAGMLKTIERGVDAIANLKKHGPEGKDHLSQEQIGQLERAIHEAVLAKDKLDKLTEDKD